MNDKIGRTKTLRFNLVTNICIHISSDDGDFLRKHLAILRAFFPMQRAYWPCMKGF